jgi:hypothetical protein
MVHVVHLQAGEGRHTYSNWMLVAPGFGIPVTGIMALNDGGPPLVLENELHDEALFYCAI